MNKNVEVLVEKARRYCSTRETSRHDMEQKLKQWGAPVEKLGEILTSLEREGFISEFRFARAAAADKFRFEKWGRNKIRHFLLQHHISEAAVEEALQSIDEEEYRALILRELKKKNDTIRSGTFWERKSKLYRFAQGRGYENDLIMQALDQIVNE